MCIEDCCRVGYTMSFSLPLSSSLTVDSFSLSHSLLSVMDWHGQPWAYLETPVHGPIRAHQRVLVKSGSPRRGQAPSLRLLLLHYYYYNLLLQLNCTISPSHSRSYQNPQSFISSYSSFSAISTYISSAPFPSFLNRSVHPHSSSHRSPFSGSEKANKSTITLHTQYSGMVPLCLCNPVQNERRAQTDTAHRPNRHWQASRREWRAPQAH